MRYTKCLFCDNPKARGDSLCSFCKSIYDPYRSESWFKELVQMEQLQNKINKYESANYNVDHAHRSGDFQYGASKPRGRPKTTAVIESYIRSIYDSSLSVRQLTRLCNSVGLVVSRESVRAIMNKIKLTKN